MANAVVSSKGQVVIPKSFRDQLGIKEGTRLEFSNVNDNLVLKIVKDKKRLTRAELIAEAALIKPEDRPTLIDFGDDPIINDGWVGRPAEEYETIEEFLKEWNDFVAKSR